MKEWRPTVGWSTYEVSSDGEIKSLRRGILLKPFLMNHGYFCVSLNEFGRRKTQLVHRLVCQAFHPNPENLREVNHINFVKTDNSSVNLEWTSPKQNTQHTVKNLRHPHGENFRDAKLLEVDIPLVFQARSVGLTFKLIADKFGISTSQAHRIIHKMQWKHLFKTS